MNSRDLAVIVLVILGAVVILPVAMMWLGGWGMMGPGVMGPGMMGRWGYGSGSWFGPLIFLLLVAGIVLFALIVRRQPKTDDPQTVLKQRLARGEITKEQFEGLKQALQ
jgi:uncharacterized membrane protein